MRRRPNVTPFFALLLLPLLAGCAGVESTPMPVATSDDPDDLIIVDCLLPGQVRQLGQQVTYVTARPAIRTSAVDCRVRGGEYTSHDRADYGTALKVWLPLAKEGDAEAQNMVGEIHERGLGTGPDYEVAASWYRKAAEQGLSEAMINLGQLYDRGLGVPEDAAEARRWYRKASGLSEDEYVGGASAEKAPAEQRPRSAPAQPGPEIQLIDPPLEFQTRGLGVVSLRTRPAARVIVGRVTAPAGLVSVVVADEEVMVNERGIFRARVPLAGSSTAVRVRAVDEQGKVAEREFTLNTPAAPAAAPPAPEAPADADFGRYTALVIGNDAYQHLPRLRTARKDADVLADMLASRYGFDVTLLYDATRYEILSALNRLRGQLTERDNLLVYYAGHGELDEANNRGHWLPVDAESSSTANWISNVAITDILNAMSARHILVVSDSCYSGSLTRSALAHLEAGLTPEQRALWQRTMASKRSRTALTSGGLAPVLDSGGGEHSVFAKHFLDVLRSNVDILEGQRLYREIAARVAYSADQQQFEQVPQYAPIRFAGHESGDFFFIPEGG